MNLYRRLTKDGTVSEPKGIPDPVFALPATLNWPRALSICLKHQPLNFQSSLSNYMSVGTRKASPQEENTVLEQLLFALHQCSALQALRSVTSKSDIVRVSIVAWYYGIYSAASAMVAAQDGSLQEDHTGTARVWDQQIAMKGLALFPFDHRLSSLVKITTDSELANYLIGQKFNLAGAAPETEQEANAANIAYLSGNANYWRDRIENDLRESKDFKTSGFTDFRKMEAKKLRDTQFSKRGICFLHQAIRYRGKANYREALYLGYGNSLEGKLEYYIDDLSHVLDAFTSMAGAFCSRRLGKSIWNEFVSDLESNRSFVLRPISIWTKEHA